MNYLARKKKEKTNWTLDELEKYRTLQRGMLISVSFSPNRYLPDISDLKQKTKTKIIGKMATKIVANFVHSLDAAHMARTINTMYAHHGIQDFASIHDCFAVHPSDTDALVESVRQTFHNLHSGRSIEDWMLELKTPSAFKIDESEFDIFDIDQVLESNNIIS